MIDSCRLRKLDPGLDAMYSMPVALMTSTMKSEPGRAITLSRLGGASLPLELDSAASAGLFAAICVPITAAAVAAAPFKNARRSKLSLAMMHLPASCQMKQRFPEFGVAAERSDRSRTRARLSMENDHRCCEGRIAVAESETAAKNSSQMTCLCVVW